MPGADGTPPSADNVAKARRIMSTLNSRNPKGAAAVAGDISSFSEALNTNAEDVISGKTTPDDPGIVGQLDRGMSLPIGSPGATTQVQLDQARANHQISQSTYEDRSKWLKDSADNPQLKEGEADLMRFYNQVVRPQLTHSTALDPNTGQPVQTLFPGSVDANGDVAAGEAQRELLLRYRGEVAKGEDPRKVVQDMEDPTSPHYALRAMPYWKQGAAAGPSFFANHPVDVGGPADQQTSAIDTARANPIKPGESMSAYLKRVGG